VDGAAVGALVAGVLGTVVVVAGAEGAAQVVAGGDAGAAARAAPVVVVPEAWRSASDPASPLASSQPPVAAIARSTINTRTIKPHGRLAASGTDSDALERAGGLAIALDRASAPPFGAARLSKAEPCDGTRAGIAGGIAGAGGSVGTPYGLGAGATAGTPGPGDVESGERDSRWGGAGETPTRAPHPPQKRESGAFSVPQLGQRIQRSA
jgi:hypothetical protein